MRNRTEITTAVREWKAQRSAELRLKVKLLQQELLWAIDDLQQHNKLQGEELFWAANNEGVAWNEEEWMEEMRALWTIPTHPALAPGHTTTDAPTNQVQTPHDREADETHALVPVLAHR
jgi:hypothetical protein